jgi:MFS transporter, FHS family, L-fucose permease
MQYTDGARPAPRAITGGAAASYAVALVVSLFFLWGVANNLNDILIKQFKKAFELSDFEAGLVQSAFYVGYFVFAIPASICMRRLGYKAALLAGLTLYATGAFLFYPAAASHTYGSFLLALFVIASGLAFLETSANPLVTVLGPPERAAWRLNLAQSFNPVGSITGVLIGQHFILSGVEHSRSQLAAMSEAARHAYYVSESAAVKGPYLTIGAVVVLWAALIAFTRLPTVVQDGGDRRSFRSHASGLLRNSNFTFAVVAQFFYVGAQVGIWSFFIRYAQRALPGIPEKNAANFLTLSLVMFMLGRLIGTAMMRYLSPNRLLAAFAVINMLLGAIAAGYPGRAGVGALVAMSFFMSIMFPTIFALGLRGLADDDRKLGSSFLVMAIIGGAILTAAMGAVSDRVGIERAVVVPMVSFAVVFAFSLHSNRSTPVYE